MRNLIALASLELAGSQSLLFQSSALKLQIFLSSIIFSTGCRSMLPCPRARCSSHFPELSCRWMCARAGWLKNSCSVPQVLAWPTSSTKPMPCRSKSGLLKKSQSLLGIFSTARRMPSSSCKGASSPSDWSRQRSASRQQKLQGV